MSEEKTVFKLTKGVMPRSKDVVNREVSNILDVVSMHFSVSKKAITANNRDAIGCKPRFICMYLMMQMREMTLGKTASFFGRNNHSTTIHAINTVCEMIEENADYRKELSAIIKKLNDIEYEQIKAPNHE